MFFKDFMQVLINNGHFDWFTYAVNLYLSQQKRIWWMACINFVLEISLLGFDNWPFAASSQQQGTTDFITIVSFSPIHCS